MVSDEATKGPSKTQGTLLGWMFLDYRCFSWHVFFLARTGMQKSMSQTLLWLRFGVLPNSFKFREKKSAQDVAVFLGWEVLFETRNLHQALPATPPPFAAPQGLALRRAHCRVDVLGAHSRPPAPGRSANGGWRLIESAPFLSAKLIYKSNLPKW